MNIRFLEDCGLEVIESFNPEDETIDSSIDKFRKGEVHDVDVTDIPNEHSTSIQFGDGSVALSVPNEYFEYVGKKFYDLIIETIHQGGAIRLNGDLITTVNSSKWNNDPDNEVLLLMWEDNGEEYIEKITEEDLDRAELNENGEIRYLDPEMKRGYSGITLLRPYKIEE